MIGQIKCHSNQIISQKGALKIKTAVICQWFYELYVAFDIP